MDIQNSFNYLLVELRNLFQGNQVNLLNFDRIRRIYFIAYLFHKGGISTFPFEKHQLISPYQEHKKFLREMNWWPSLHFLELTVQTHQQISLETFDEYYITEMVNFLGLEENIANSECDLLATTELNEPFPLPFTDFILAYLLKSAISIIPLLFERYPPVLIIDFKKFIRLF